MKDLEHGKASTYNNHKCRCPECTRAWAAYMRPRMAERRRKRKELEKKKGANVNL